MLGYYTTVHPNDDPFLHDIELITPADATIISEVILNQSIFKSLSDSTFRYIRNKFRKPCAYLCDIWLLLTMVAFLCACLSFSLNECIKESLKSESFKKYQASPLINFIKISIVVRHFFLNIVADKHLKYCVWMMLTIFPIWFATKFVQIVAPQSVGSGVPELKAIIKGVEVKDFLTAECLFAKIVGLLAVLGAVFPLGKEFTFIHIAAILAHLLSAKTSNTDIFSNELKQRDILVSASAIGLASALVSPIGGMR